MIQASRWCIVFYQNKKLISLQHADLRTINSLSLAFRMSENTLKVGPIWLHCTALNRGVHEMGSKYSTVAFLFHLFVLNQLCQILFVTEAYIYIFVRWAIKSLFLRSFIIFPPIEQFMFVSLSNFTLCWTVFCMLYWKWMYK